MYIILKTSPSDNDEIINIFYCNDLTIVRNWVRQYIETDIKSLEFCPRTEDLRNITYELNDADKNIQLIKKYKRISKGYIYNSCERIVDIIYSISILEFDSDKCVTGLSCSNQFQNVNNEINRRILRQLDKDSLFKVFMKIQERIHTKQTWNKTEYTCLVSETIKNFKKQLYTSISKKMKRFNKRMYNVPDNFNSPRFSCKLEADKN